MVTQTQDGVRYMTDKEKIWVFTDEHYAEHEFSDPFEMMKHLWQHYILDEHDNTTIGWRVKEND